jgi:hypothetical protein
MTASSGRLASLALASPKHKKAFLIAWKAQKYGPDVASATALRLNNEPKSSAVKTRVF